MRLTWLLLIVTLLPLPAQAGPADHFIPPDISLLAEDQQGLTLELTLPPWRLEPAEGPDGPCLRVWLAGWARTAEVGLPELPRLGCSIVLPPGTVAAARVLEAEFESREAEQIFPVPFPGPDERHPATPRELTSAWPASLVEVDAPTVARGERRARVLFQPFRWDPQSGRLHTAVRLTVRVDILAAPAVEDGWRALRPGGPGAQTRAAVRLEVTEDGLHAFDYLEALMLTGMSVVQAQGVNPATLKLTTGGLEVPLLLDGTMLYFYGQSWRTEFTGTNVYWLRWGGDPGARMGLVDGTILPLGLEVDSISETLRFEEDSLLWDATPGAPDTDYWFWDQLTAPVTYDCALQVPDPADGQWNGRVRVCCQGRSTASPHPNHHTRILVNAHDIGGEFWDNDEINIQQADFPSTLLADGQNTISVDCPGDTGASIDIIYLNWIDVEYTRSLRAVAGELAFGVHAGVPLNFTVRGFTDPAVTVLEITSPYAVKQVTGVTVEEQGGLFDIRFGLETPRPARFLALNDDAVRAPAAMEAWVSPRLRSGGAGADYILIAPRSFLLTAGHLVKFREQQGYRARAVAVEDVYNEFSHGRTDPAAIRDFLANAYHEWKPPAPEFVLLLGDANTDYRDHFGSGKASLVPVHLSVTELGLTPDDNWYVAVEGGDVLPEMAIGRLPAADPAMAKRVVDRLLIHERSVAPAPSHALFVADDDSIFEHLNETVAAMLPAAISPDRVYLLDYPDTETATADIRRAFGRGEMLVHYNGHGAVTNWAGEMLFDTADAAELTNGDELAFVLTMTCLNGYFSHPFYYCMAEELGAVSPGGGFGCFSPSGLSYTWEQSLLAPQIFSNIFDLGEDRIGVIVTEAKLAAYALGGGDAMVSMFTLIGDPASRLHPWE